ncbi:Flp pilus assembly protein CpaB [Sedimentibacter acidaminivorans]|uniref:Flp pilus assembly protein CpaB n=1 Tax=Sedimentibacter acidaminivorans TaxID=913099 RepID=A0ABS4GGB5_9FIRM|nr:Flp pilus assembly protein CpaB [Sedimentibacter acidaminivorans]
MKLNKKVNIFKATAAFLIILAAVFYYYEEIKVPEANIETIEVIVATSNIKENTVIKKNMLSIEKRYAEDVLKTGNIARTYDEVVGKRTIVPLYKNEMINNNRIIENKKYMNNKDQTQIAISLNEVDKALELHQGDYIDIWLEPVSQSQDNQEVIEPHKLIEKIQIVSIHDSNYNNIEKEKKTVSEDSIITSDTVHVSAYITIEFSDEALKEIYSVDKNLYTLRVTRYGEEKFYSIVGRIIEGVE